MNGWMRDVLCLLGPARRRTRPTIILPAESSQHKAALVSVGAGPQARSSLMDWMMSVVDTSAVRGRYTTSHSSL